MDERVKIGSVFSYYKVGRILWLSSRRWMPNIFADVVSHIPPFRGEYVIFRRLWVAAVNLSDGRLSVGDAIPVEGATTNLAFTINSLHVVRQPIQLAEVGSVRRHSSPRQSAA